MFMFAGYIFRGVGVSNFFGVVKEPLKKQPLLVVLLTDCMLMILEIWIDLSWSKLRSKDHGPWPTLWFHFHVIFT